MTTLMLITRVTLIITIIALAMKAIQVVVDEYDGQKNMHE
jgi:hypothetical protein